MDRVLVLDDACQCLVPFGELEEVLVCKVAILPESFELLLGTLLVVALALDVV